VADQEDGSRAPALALVAELMKARIDEGWFAQPWRTTRIPDVDALLPQVVLGQNVSGGDIVQSDPAAWVP
jgi:hypothetical protein